MRKHTSIAGFTALGLLMLASGCGGGANSPVSTTSNQNVLPEGGTSTSSTHKVSGAWETCTPFSNTSNFNGTPIPPGSWIWFSSVMSVPGYNGNLNLYMGDSHISFKAGGTSYVISGPYMKLSLQRGQALGFGENDNTTWYLNAPQRTEGKNFLNGIGYYTSTGLPGGINRVTWSAKFYSPQPHWIHWQWAAAVYTTFSNLYGSLGVKPLNDIHYPPYNSDHAGTPENYKQYLSGGATGGGGSNWTGSLSGTVNVTPCKT